MDEPMHNRKTEKLHNIFQRGQQPAVRRPIGAKGGGDGWARPAGQPGGGPFGVWGDVLRGGPLPAVSSPPYGYALFRESLPMRSPPYDL